MDWQALRLTLQLAMCTTAILLVTGLPLAYWLASSRWRGRFLVESLVTLPLGTRPETSESVLMRVANDSDSVDFNNTQLEGNYYYAQTSADVSAAFQQLQNQIVRLSK